MAKLFIRLSLCTAIGSMVLPSSWAMAQSEAEILGLHQLCNRGDRAACVRFGMAIEHNRDRIAEWRRTHADWFWWER